MQDSPEVVERRRRLREHIAARHGDNVAAYARVVQRQPQQIADMISAPPRKAFGEKVARGLAAAEGLPPDYFLRTDLPYEAPVPVPSRWPFSISQSDLEALSAEDMQRLDDMIAGFVTAARRRKGGRPAAQRRASAR